MTDKKPEPNPSAGAKPKASPPAATLPAGLPPPMADTIETPPVRAKRDWVPVLYFVGFIVLAGATVWLWQNPPASPAPPPSPGIATLRQQLQALQDRVATLEKRPAPVTAPAAAPTDLAPLTARVAALEARKPVDLGPLEATIATLEQKPAGDPALPGRMDALSGRVDGLTSRVDAAANAAASLAQRQTATDARLAPLEKDSGQITALADRSARIARLQAAQAALDSGVKLGDLPGAPAALAKYATAAPPTEAGLRLAFPAAADAAMAAAKPAVDDKPFLDRAWARAQDLVTLRQGDHVIVGDPAAGVLARARAALDAGDLAGCVAALNALSGPAAAAMASWKAQAQGLLDARGALADMAAHA
jgi:hypothetical protein